MHSPSFVRKKIIRLTGVIFILILLTLLLPPLHQYASKKHIRKAKVEKTIAHKFNIAEEYLEKIGKGNFLEGKEGEDLFQEQGIALFYQNDTMEWWSTHDVPVTEDWTEIKTGPGILLPGNGFYLPLHIDTNGTNILALILIKRDYPYQNRYLPNTFQNDLWVSETFTVSSIECVQNIYAPDGGFLFSLSGSGEIRTNPFIQAVNIVLWIIVYVLLAALLYHIYLILVNFKGRHVWIVAGFAIDLIIIRGLIFYFRIPTFIHDTNLFQPITYAASALIPSLGDLLLHTITLCWIAWVAFRHIPHSKPRPLQSRYYQWLISFAGNFLILCMAVWAGGLFKSLVLDSMINFGLDDPFNLSWNGLLGYLSIFLVLIAWFLWAFRWSWLAKALTINTAYWLTSLFVAILAGVLYFGNSLGDLLLLIFSGIVLVSFWAYHNKRVFKSSLVLLTACIIGVSGLLTTLMQFYADQKEKESRKLLALRMSQSRDQVAEYLFEDMYSRLLGDTTLINLVAHSVKQGEEGIIKDYLRQMHFSDYWDRYELMVTLCTPGRMLEVKPANYIIPCSTYFQELIQNVGQPLGVDHLFFIDLGIDNSSYLAILPFSPEKSTDLVATLYLEFYPRFIPRGMGYPELLMDESKAPETLKDYNYAIYRNDELIRRVGRFYYSHSASTYFPKHQEGSFFTEDGYVHYLKSIDEDAMIIMSLPRKSLLDLMAPFSYLLVFSSLFLALFYLVSTGTILRGRHRQTTDKLTLRTRLQFSMAAVVMVSFVLVAAASLWFLTRINQNKNRASLSEKAHSVLVEMEHKLSQRDFLTLAEAPYVQELLNKFSQVFFSDINVYGVDGHLLASSRKRVFDEGLISLRMNAEAWDRMSRKQESMVILNERIGDYHYLSAYVPFHNNRNELLAYLNLPYFARQAELRQEISGFLVAIINIYVILIALTLSTALVVSGYISKPLQLIGEKIKKVKLGDVNERIEWHRQDEIGRLVDEYNRMVDQLAESADLLAHTEREFAWREMAKQVAHEIKNPLTPMKLSVQYLQRAWDDKAPGWDERLQRFTATLTEQIDALSNIASAFSDFARMPQVKTELSDLGEIAMLALETYRGNENIHFIQDWNTSKRYPVQADRSQLLRVYNNLIKNAIQAIGVNNEGQVRIDIQKDNSFFRVSISDSGSGIPNEKKEKIFTPNFTTKSSGMGLGLAMVRNIILSFGGNVWYESEEGNGTVFHFTLPIYQDTADTGTMD